MKQLLYIVIIFHLSSCKKEQQQSVITKNIPIVFVHGFLASGDTYEKQAKRFTSNGYSLDEIYAFDYNSLLGTNTEQKLDKFIDEVLQRTGASKINLVGHSRGAGLVYDYCKASTRANKIANLVMLAGFLQTQPAGPNAEIPTLNIYSVADKIVVISGNVPKATNLKLTDKDHYEVATCIETFTTMFEFFNNKTPITTDIINENQIYLSGVASSFGENIPRLNTKVEIYSINNNTGFRNNINPDTILYTDAKGNWGTFFAQPATYYEFVVSNDGVAGDRKVHYYREPFQRSDKLVYLRTFPTGNSLAKVFLSGLPSNDNQSVIAFFGASQAILAGRDSLLVNNYNYSTATFATAQNTTIALFLYDTNNNNNSEYSSVATFNLFPFLKGADTYFPTTLPQTIIFNLNGRVIPVKNWKSKTEGISVAVFE